MLLFGMQNQGSMKRYLHQSLQDRMDSLSESVDQVSDQHDSLFDHKNLLVACDPRMGFVTSILLLCVFLICALLFLLRFSRYLTAATIFRGNVSSREVSFSPCELSKNAMTFISPAG